MAVTVAFFVLGLVLLTVGGEALIRGATLLGVRWGLSIAVVGLTIVAVMTSAPELAVTVDAVATGSPELAVGNVLGSNTANLWAVLGAAALLRAFGVSRDALRRDVPVVLGVSVLFGVLALDGAIGRLDGLVLLLVMGGYLGWCIRLDRRRPSEADAEPSADVPDVPQRGVPYGLLLVLIGVALLTYGADRLVASATEIATALGLSDLVIGLTIVALGTSLPELTATAMAAWRRRGDLGVGNVLGSNVANLAFVAGLAALVLGDIAVPDSALRFDLPVSVLALLMVWAMGYLGNNLTRLEGAVLLTAYVAYLGWLVLDGTGQPVFASYRVVVLVAAAVTALVLVVLVVRQFASRRRATAAAEQP